MPARVISMVGKNGAGKTTCASTLAEALRGYGYNVQELSFATPLKKIAAAYLDTTKEKGGRTTLDFFGQDLKKQIGEDIFARSLVNRVDPEADYVIIDDMRFMVEYEALIDAFDWVKIFHVNRKTALSESLDIVNRDLKRLDKLLYGLVCVDHEPDFEIIGDIEYELANMLGFLGIGHGVIFGVPVVFSPYLNIIERK